MRGPPDAGRVEARLGFCVGCWLAVGFSQRTLPHVVPALPMLGLRLLPDFFALWAILPSLQHLTPILTLQLPSPAVCFLCYPHSLHPPNRGLIILHRLKKTPLIPSPISSPLLLQPNRGIFNNHQAHAATPLSFDPAHAFTILTIMRAAILPRLDRLNPLRLLPASMVPFAYEKLPGGDANHHGPRSPFSTMSFKKYRWRSPSPGGRRFPLFVKISPSRFIVFAITTILCLGLIIVGGYRNHQKMKNKKPPPREEYRWENFTMYVLLLCLSR